MSITKVTVEEMVKDSAWDSKVKVEKETGNDV